MMSETAKANEEQRLAALLRYEVLDTLPEPNFDDLTALASQICETPIALISLIDESRQWFKSRIGLDVSETSREIAFCTHAIAGQTTLEVENALADIRFSSNPLVLGEPRIRFYAGHPLTTPDDRNIGTLCVIDQVPRKLTQPQRLALARLARQVVVQLELRLANRRLAGQLTFESSLLASVGSAVIGIDRNSRVTRFNPTAESMLGCTASDILGRECWGLFAAAVANPVGTEETLPALVAQAGDGETISREWFLTAVNGRSIPVILSIAAIHGSDGKISGTLFAAYDISARVAAEDERNRFFLQSPDLLCVAGANGYLKRVNPAFVRTLGWSETELLHRPLRDLIHPDDLAATGEAVTVVSAGQTVRDFENRYLARTGGYRIIAWQATAQADGDIFASGRDVTEARAASAELGTHRRLLEASQAIAKVGGWELDLQSSTLYWTRETFRLHDTSPEEYQPSVETAINFYDRASRKKLLKTFRLAVETLQPYDLVLQITTVKGRQIWARTTGQVTAVNGKAARLTGIFQDITERVANEASLRRSNRQLKEQAQALRRAQQQAEAGSRAKSAFLANMSHEIRTPLNAIVGTVDLLAGTPDSEDSSRMLAVLKDSSKALVGIIDDVLDFSKIEAGLLEVRPEPVALRQLIDSAVNTFSSSALSKGLSLKLDWDPQIPERLICDPLRLKQVLFNLIGNAIKFTRHGGVTVSARQLGYTTGTASILIEVADTGIGISPEAQGKLFQPFVQADGDTTREFGGTGLGLVISRRLVEMMQGKLSIDSVVDRGTTMSLTLDLAVAETPADSPPPPANPSPTTPYANVLAQGRGHLLIADDNPVNLELLSLQVAALGFSADKATDGMEALRLWEQNEYDLIFSDYHMPRLDGHALVRAIRKIESESPDRRRTPIIGYTANAMHEARAGSIDAGMDDVLVKPVELTSLQILLERWLGPGASARNETA
ncbi:MAG: ATP-binding protein [Lysobacterales bacterium]